MRIAICDDQEAIRNRLFQSIKSYFINNEITNPTITLFSDAISLLDSIKQKNFYDIIFLDIDMPQLSGMDCAKEIRRLSSDNIIVFVTNYSEYMPNAFTVEAFGFIVKDRLCQKLPEVLDRCLLKYQKLHSNILFVSKKRQINLIPREIIYVSSYLRSVTFHLVSGEEIELTYQIKECDAKLAPFDFFFFLHSILVNLSYVSEIQDKTLILKVPMQKKRIELPIGGKYYDSFIETFMFSKTRKGVL